MTKGCNPQKMITITSCYLRLDTCPPPSRSGLASGREEGRDRVAIFLLAPALSPKGGVKMGLFSR